MLAFIKKDSLYKNSALLFIASMAGNFFQYLFQFFMGRNLSIADFGAMNALFSFTVITSVGTGTIGLVITKYIAGFKGKNEIGKIKGIILKSSKYIIPAGVIVSILVFAARFQIMDYYKLEHTSPVIIVSFSLFVSCILSLFFAVATGMQRFNYIALGQILGPLSRIGSGALLVWLGFGLNGAILASVVASITGILIFSKVIRDIVKVKIESVKKYKKEMLLFCMPVAMSISFYAVLTMIDMTLVKHYFSANIAGQYAAISVLGKSVLYLPGAIVLVMFPMVAEAHTINKDTLSILKKALISTAFLCLAGILIFFLFPDFLLRLISRGRYVGNVNLLWMFGLAMLPYALTGVINSFHIARHKISFIVALVIMTIVQVALICMFHNSLEQVIYILLICGVLLILINFGLIFYERKS
ncbi:MAG: oligosaccharide flippase family protein [bacterium]|nr:oligosaccharide flippase family protein [bacterium]